MKCTTTQNRHKKLEPGLVAFYNIRSGNAVGLFSNEKISKGGDKQGKSEEKRINGATCDINKQTIGLNIMPKSKIESRAHYTSQPAQRGHPEMKRNRAQLLTKVFR